MNLNEFAELMQSRADLLQDPAIKERLAVVAANDVSIAVKRRVFRDGIAQDGSNIGKYSTKEAWFSISKPGLPRIAPKGKRQPSTAKKTYYSDTGYSGYRSKVGRQNSKVDLNLTGGTFNAVGTGIGSKGLIAFGIKTDLAQKLIEGNEERFGCITVTPNEQERQAGIDAATRELKFILNID